MAEGEVFFREEVVVGCGAPSFQAAGFCMGFHRVRVVPEAVLPP